MMRFLLCLLLSGMVASAQNEPQPSAFSNGQGVQGQVNAVVIQPDGKVVLGGRFTAVNGEPRGNLARLNADGTLDRGFAPNPEAGVNGEISALALQSDGAILVGGVFSQAGSMDAMNLARFKPDGTVDGTFGKTTSAQATDGVVLALAVQPDGKIVLGGNFNFVFGQPRRGVARLNADGSPDQPVLPSSAFSGSVRGVAIAGGNLVAGGSFTVESHPSRSILRVPIAAY